MPCCSAVHRIHELKNHLCKCEEFVIFFTDLRHSAIVKLEGNGLCFHWN